MATETVAGTRGPYRTGIRRKEQIVSAAIDVFGEFGFAGGTIRSIAERVGVSHAALLQHFGSKEGLLMAVLQEWDRRTVDDGLAGLSGLDYLFALPETAASHTSQRGLLELFTTIAAEASSPTHPAHDYIQRRYSANLATLSAHIRRAAAAGEIRSMTASDITREVRLITAVLDGIGLQWLLDPSTDIREAVEAYIRRSVAAWSDPLRPAAASGPRGTRRP